MLKNRELTSVRPRELPMLGGAVTGQWSCVPRNQSGRRSESSFGNF